MPRMYQPLHRRPNSALSRALPAGPGIEALERRQLLSVTTAAGANNVPFQRIVIDQNPGALPLGKSLADINGDGKLDIVVAHDDGRSGLVWYQFPGSGVATDPWNKYTIATGGSAHEDMLSYDVNGDGAVDIIASWNNSVIWFENPRGHGGDPRSGPWVQHVIGPGEAHDMVQADLDGDGKIDIATSSHIYFQNNSTSWTTVSAPAYSRGPFGAQKFDSGSGNGAVDLIARGNAPYSIVWLENPRDHGGNARTDTWLPHTIGPGYAPNDPKAGVTFATMDVNGDGRQDVITAQSEASNDFAPAPGGMIWWEAPLDRKNGTWIPHTIDGSLQSVHKISLADINGDGRTDIVFAEQEQSLQDRVGVLYQVDAAGNNWQEQVFSTGSGHNLDVGDVNGDGTLDILNAPHGFYTRVNPVELYLNQRNGASTPVSTPVVSPGPPVIPVDNQGAPPTNTTPGAGGGSLWGQQAAAGSSYNLTSIGASDWAHWGRGGNFGNFDHNATGNSQISTASIVGAGSNNGGWSDASRATTWAGGAPAGSGTNDHGYIWSNGAVNTGYSFSVPADTTTRTLTVYAGGINISSSLTAHLSDGSAADYVATATGTGLYTKVYTITYHAASANQKLVVTLLKTGNVVRTDGSADLIAATLSGAPVAGTVGQTDPAAPPTTVTPVVIPTTGAGSLSGQQAAATSSYNLSTQGASDWAHWGRGGNFGNFDHNATGGSQISSASIVGAGSNNGGWSDASRATTWAGGAPAGSGTNDHGYIWANGAVNTGYSFSVPADTTTRTLTVYAGGINISSSLTAHLSDGSAADYVATATGKGLYTNVYTITYHAASGNQKLVVTLLKTGNVVRTDGSADLIAATLA